MIEYNLTKDKHNNKTVYRLEIYKDRERFERCFLNPIRFTNVISGRSIGYFAQQMQEFYTTSKMRKEFLDKYSKIDTIDKLSKCIHINKYKLEFTLKKYGFIDNPNGELLFEFKNIDSLKDFLSSYFNAIEIVNILSEA